jgi:hypothetical protein
MNWYELAALILGAGGIGGLIATIAGVIRDRRKSVTEQKGSAIEQGKETLSLIDELYQKQIKWMSERMDSNDNVRKQEFDQLRTDIGSQLSDIQVENRAQNETIGTMSELLSDIKEYLNGGFAAFEEGKLKNKRRRTSKS